MRLRKSLSRDTLLTIYKAFVRPHLDYGDIIYDNPGNISFTQKIEPVQYNAALAITGCIRGTSRENLYCELGLESLTDRRFCRRFVSSTMRSVVLLRLICYRIFRITIPVHTLLDQNRLYINLLFALNVSKTPFSLSVFPN